MSVVHPRIGERPRAARSQRLRWVSITSASVAAVVTFGAVATAGGRSAGAADSLRSQSVGNFLDAAAQGKPLDQVVKLEYATATSPGTQSTQNPLHATLLGNVDLPLTHALQFPKTAGATAGVLNQVAVAKPNGYAYGASGAVLNSGGVSIGGTDNAYPSVASVDLCASAMSGHACGKNPADAIGELKLDVGAVAGLAQTPKGFGKKGTTQYGIAGVDLDMSSPLLAGLLKQVDSAFSTVVGQLSSQLDQLPQKPELPKACTLTYDKTMSFGGGAVTIDAATGTLTFHLAQLVKILAGKDINSLPANTDLIAYLLKYLADKDGLAKGIQDFLDGITKPLQGRFEDCSSALGKIDAVSKATDALQQLQTQLTNGQTQVKGAVAGVLSQLGGNSGQLLDPLTKVLESVIDIGVNVQPNGPDGDFKTGLDATPKQGTDVIPGQTIVRAIEIDFFDASGLNANAAGTPKAKAKAARKAAAPGLAVALGNAAAGPGTPPTVVTSQPAVPRNSNPAQIPTGVPAGRADTGGSPSLPLTLVAAGLILAAGGVGLGARARGKLHRH